MGKLHFHDNQMKIVDSYETDKHTNNDIAVQNAVVWAYPH